MRRILRMLPVLCGSLFLAILLLGRPVRADVTGTCGDNVRYQLQDDGTLIVYTYGEGAGIMTDYEDPSKPTSTILSPFTGNTDILRVVFHPRVTHIGDWAFQSCTNMKTATFHNDMLSIGNWAFIGAGLTSLNLPESLQIVGTGAFEQCERLEYVIVPDQADLGVAGRTFLYCYGLTQFVVSGSNARYTERNGVLFSKDMKELIAWPAGKAGEYEIPDGVQEIWDYAFCCAQQLSAVNLPDSVQTIGYAAFERCPTLTEITIPGSVQTVGKRAFYECMRLKTLVLEEGVSVIDEAAFYGCRGLRGVALPDSVTFLGKYAFGMYYDSNPMYLESIFIPAGVTSIDPLAFKNCPWLTIYGIKGSPAETAAQAAHIPFKEGGRCGKAVFWSLDEFGTLDIMGTGPMEDYGMYENRSPWRESLTQIVTATVHDGVTTVGAYAFALCSGMNQVFLSGDGLERIGDSAFNSCHALTSVSLPESLTHIDSGAFNNCGRLEQIRAYCHEVLLGYLAFANCPLLTIYAYTDSPVYAYAVEWNIPVIQLDDMDMADLRLPWNLEEIGEEAFAGNTAEVIYIRYNVKRIGKRAFANCGSLRQILIPENVTEIAEDAFEGCPSTLVIYSHTGSEAFAYAREHGFARGLEPYG